jgi:molybdenum ABC transporter molybdate-binding protein
VPATSTATFGSVKHLSRPEVKHLALAAETVPAGKYARAALTSAGAWEAVKDRVVNGENVRTVLGWVASKEADAGFVYATDAKIEPKVKVALTVPAASYPRSSTQRRSSGARRTRKRPPSSSRTAEAPTGWRSSLRQGSRRRR